MAGGLESDNVSYNKRVVLASTIVVLFFSNVSYILRLLARRKQKQRLQLDDYLMGLALPFSYIPAVCLLYGLSVGLGEHVKEVSKADLKKFNISLFILQRGNPPCLLCVKSSILVLYCRLFRTQTFKRVAFGAWLFTAAWAVSAFMSNLFQCTPVSYFWDKTQHGRCLPNALITIGMTNGVLSFVGDLFILCMPLPMIWNLQIDRRRKMALTGIFLLGGFVCLTSILRFIALAQINVKDITFTQVAPGVWTYIELGTGITSGNLPLLRPLFGHWLGVGSRNASSAPTYSTGSKPISYPLSRVTVNGTGNRPDGFHRMDKSGNDVDVESVGDGSEVELNLKKKEESGIAKDRKVDGIQVRTDVDFKVEEIRQGAGSESSGTQERTSGSSLNSNPSHSTRVT